MTPSFFKPTFPRPSWQECEHRRQFRKLCLVDPDDNPDSFLPAICHWTLHGAESWHRINAGRNEELIPKLEEVKLHTQEPPPLKKV